MGNEASSQRSNSNRAQSQPINRKIVVVNTVNESIEKIKKQPEDELLDEIRSLQFNPLVAIGSDSVPSTHMHVNHEPYAKICRLLQKTFKFKAQLVQREQTQLAESIRDIDFATAYLASCFSDRERRLQRVIDTFGRLNQIVGGVSRCEQSMKDLETQVNQLNQLLPEDQKLEEFTLSL